MKPERLEELRQMAGAIDGPKSAWMDELIEEVDRLNLQINEMAAAFQILVDRIEKRSDLGPGMYAIELEGVEWDRAAKPFFALKRTDEPPKITK